MPNIVRGQLEQDQRTLNFTITEVDQCAPFGINFSSNVNEMDLPMTFTILPFSSSPIVIPIPNIVLNTAGFTASFLPLKQDTQFIASLDNQDGQSIAHILGVTTVMPSPTNNNTCLPSSGLALHSKDNNFKLLTTAPAQCQDIILSYDTGAILKGPNVRAFAPNGASAVLPQTSDDPANGAATYTMIMQHGTQVLLMFDDGFQHRETTNLLTVAGDSNSPRDCLNKVHVTVNSTQAIGASATTTGNPQGDAQGPTPIPQEVIIGCSAGGAVIVIIAISMVVFVIRDRKLRRRQKHLRKSFCQLPQEEFQAPPPQGPLPFKPLRDVTPLKTMESTSVAIPSPNPFEVSPALERGSVAAEGGNVTGDGGYITNPPYVMGELVKGADDGKVPLARRSFSSWTNDDGSNTSREASMHRRPSVDPVQSLDIEGMLNMATALSGTQITKQAIVDDASDAPKSLRSTRDSQSTVKSLGAFPSIPEGSILTDPARTRHWRAPSDVPADLTGSGTLSGFSMVVPNPFNDDREVELPSPFNRTDEPARPASDTVRPESMERIRRETEALCNPEGQGGNEEEEEERLVVIESREEI
ncbi:hypothetical protein AN958_03708 [Leucoagaricus sp. SymC.cos]|nr:hypothetical protein AN958_03708 [Leucoagaricus sp. SymC.cos]